MNSKSQPPSIFDKFDCKWAVIASFGSLVSFFIALGYSFLRIGLTTPEYLAPTAVAILSAAAFSPLLLPKRGWLAELNVRFLIYPIVTLTVIMSVMLTFMLGQILLPFYYVLTVLGGARAFILMRRMGSEVKWVSLLLGAVAVSAYFFIQVHNQDLAGAFTPEQGLLGELNHDTRFHTAIAYLIQNFGIPSLGVDGILPLHYHFGSHIWFAAFGLMVGVEPLWSYSAGVPIFAVPALLLSLLFAGIAIDKARKSTHEYLVIGLGLLFMSDIIGWQSYYVSETYTFGLVAMLFLLPLFSYLAQLETTGKLSRIGFVVGMLAIPFLMSMKVSVGILWCGGVGWIALRRYGLRISGVIIGAACLSMMLVGMWLFVPSTSDYVHTNGSMIMPFYFLRQFPEMTTFSSFIMPLLLLLFVKFVAMKDYKEIFREKTELLVEATLVITVVGAIPAFLGLPQDSAVWYFMNVGQWFAMAALLARLSVADFAELKDGLLGKKLGAELVVLILFVLSSQLLKLVTPTFLTAPGTIIQAADQQSGGFLNGRTITQYVKNNIMTEHTLWGDEFRTALNQSVGAKLIYESHLAVGVPRKNFAVFIPENNTAFWDLQADYNCRDKHNVQVSLTGLPSLLGEPPKRYGCIRDAYQVNYGKETYSREISDVDLCVHARERDIADVFIFTDVKRKEKNRTLHCAK